MSNLPNRIKLKIFLTVTQDSSVEYNNFPSTKSVQCHVDAAELETLLRQNVIENISAADIWCTERESGHFSDFKKVYFSANFMADEFNSALHFFYWREEWVVLRFREHFKNR